MTNPGISEGRSATGTPAAVPPLDPLMTRLIEDELHRHKVELILSDGLAGFEATGAEIRCRLASGREIVTDSVVLSIGVRPVTALAKAAV